MKLFKRFGVLKADKRPRDEGLSCFCAVMAFALGLAGLQLIPNKDFRVCAAPFIGAVASLPCLYRLTLEDDQEPPRDHDLSEETKQYWFTDLTPLKLHWPSPECTVSDRSEEYNERIEITFHFGTFAFMRNNQAGIFLDHEAETTVIEITGITEGWGRHKARFVLQPGSWRVLPPNKHWDFRYIAVRPMVSINHLFVKHTEETRWNTDLFLAEEEICAFHREAQRIAAARVRMYEKELIARACHPKRLINCLDDKEAAVFL